MCVTNLTASFHTSPSFLEVRNEAVVLQFEVRFLSNQWIETASARRFDPRSDVMISGEWKLCSGDIKCLKYIYHMITRASSSGKSCISAWFIPCNRVVLQRPKTAQLMNKFPHHMESEGSLPCWMQPVTTPILSQANPLRTTHYTLYSHLQY
jgi:hypothetical protein